MVPSQDSSFSPENEKQPDINRLPPSEFYRALVEDMPVMVVRTDFEGLVTFVNQHFCDYYNTDAGKFIGKNFFDFFAAGERQDLIDYFQALSPKNPTHVFEVPTAHSDGTIHWLRWIERAIFTHEGDLVGFQSVGEDISSRKRLEQDLFASEEKFKSAVDNFLEGFALLADIKDENGDLVDYRIEYINSYGTKFVPERYLGTPLSNVFSQLANGKEFLASLFKISDSGKPMIYENFPIQFTDLAGKFHNQILDIRVSAISNYLVLLWRDMTDSVTMEAELKRSREDIVAMMNSSSQMLTTLDLESLLALVKERISDLVPFDNVGVYLIQKDEPEIATYHTYYRYPETESKAVSAYKKIVLPELHKSDLRSNYIVIQDSYQDDEFILHLKELIGKDSVFFIENRSMLFVPLVFHNQITGLITLVHQNPGLYTRTVCTLVRAFANLVALAVENSRFYQQAQVQAIILERLRLARELHDSVTQSLYSINLYTDAAKAALESNRIEKAAENLEELHKQALEATRELRLLIYDLRPVELEELGLVGAIRSRLSAVESRCGIKTDFVVNGQGVMDPKMENELYQIAQEGLNNITKHAAATRVNVLLEFLPDKFRMVIQDDGVGFEPESTPKGVGLKTISERITLLGGRYQITSSPKKGTILSVEIEV